MNVVIFKFNHLGDNVVFVPAVQAIRQRFPEWHVTLLTTPSAAELYRGPRGPQEIVVCQKAAFDKSYRMPWLLARWIWRVRARRPDACLVSFDQGNSAHLVAALSGARVRVGGQVDHIRSARSLTERLPEPEDHRPASWNWSMAGSLARSCGRAEDWPIAPSAPDLSHLLPKGPRLKGDRPRVVIHAGARSYLNQWPRESFAAVARDLSREFEVVWIRHGDTTGAAPPGTADTPVNSLTELAGWLAGADLFLGNNSGPMHLANALGCSGVSVTGPSAMGWDPYWHRERWTVLRHPSLACAPCERLSQELAGCANLENPMACLKYWTVERVVAACRERLARPGGGRA